MEKSELVKLLKTFSEKEWKEFILFSKSPYFNREKILITFVEILYKAYPDFNLSKDELFSLLYPGKKFNDPLMRNIISDLLKLAEEFISIEKYRKDKLQFRKNLLSELNTKNLTGRYIKHRKNLIKHTDEIKIKNGEFHYLNYQIAMDYNSFISKNNINYVNRNDSESLIENLLKFFLIDFIYLNTEIINRKKIIHDTGTNLKFEYLIEEILSKRGSIFLEIPYIKLNYFLYKIMKEDSEEYFFKLKSFSESDLQNISESDRRNIFAVLSNFSYLKVLSGDLKYVKEQFEIGLSAIKSGLFKISPGYLTHIQLLNTVITGLEYGKVTIVENLIKDYSDQVNEKFRSLTLHLCNSLVFYKKEKLEEAIKELSYINTGDFTFKQQMNSLYLKIYFDISDSESFYSHVDRYKHFISENKNVHNLVRKQLSDYINYTKRLFDFKTGVLKRDYSKLDKIEKDVNENKSLVNRSWLLKRIFKEKRREK